MSKWINEIDLLVNIVKKSRYTSKTIGEAIDESQSIEVIRCKDCKYWRDDHTCREHSLVSPMGANEFCSRGERGEQD